MAAADALFTQSDLNDFRYLTGAGGLSYGASSYGFDDISTFGVDDGLWYGGSGYGADDWSTVGVGGSYGLSSTLGTGYGGDVIYAGTGLGGAGYNSSLYNSSLGYAGSGLATFGGYQHYATDAQGIYQDPNPHIIRRPAPGGGVTYTQNVRVRYLQPPPVPAPGPLIIREVRPPQPPPPPPLRVRQQARPFPLRPPLVLRERPPVPPVPIASQTVIRRLPALPIPPRSVIVERLPPFPPKPRNIIIERWISYGPRSKRKTILQRAPAARPYPRPRNIIIQYETPQVRVVRQFQNLGVVQADPQLYVQRYGLSLLDSQFLLQQAREAGVIEDISPPILGGAFSAGSSQVFSSSGSLGYDITNTFGGYGGYESYGGYGSYGGFDAGTIGFSGIGPYQSPYYTDITDISTVGADLGTAGIFGTNLGDTSSYESSSFNVVNDVTPGSTTLTNKTVGGTTLGNTTVGGATLGGTKLDSTTSIGATLGGVTVEGARSSNTAETASLSGAASEVKRDAVSPQSESQSSRL
ncbi:unnamed protein product [Rotaria sp. Silwood2]|nr:unnamed protein product [Rotaria sp. Silwood2]CAF4048334.1 unnamed protein product [Rotaria sp. Silwood2]